MKHASWVLFLCVLSPSAFAEETATNPDPFMATDVAPPMPADAAVKEAPLPAPSNSGEPAKAAAAPTPMPTAAAPSQPEAQAPIAVSSLPGKTPGAPKVDPNAVNPNKDIYQEYNDYLEKVKVAEGTEKDIRQRELFPHENGVWQIGLEYTRYAFSDYNFNFNNSGTLDSTGNIRRVFADTQGGALSVTYFPIHSLTMGRFGVSAIGAVYFSKFSVETPSVDATSTAIGNTLTSTSRHSVDTYGIRGTYEFDYLLGQILVPFAFLGYDRVKVQGYKIGVGNITALDVPGRSIGSTSLGLGAHFNLNRVEPVVASRALVNVGVRKFYLSYTMLQRLGDLSGLTHYLGLRFEY